MTTDTTAPVADVPQPRETGTTPTTSARDDWQPPDPAKAPTWWWVAAITAVGGATAACFFTAQAAGSTTPHRTAAAGTALGVVVALALLAHAILLWYQARTIRAAGPSSDQQKLPTLAFRRRGLKAAVIGQDGRASTSKTQVVLWTAAVVWGLVDLLLLARAFGGTSLFSGAVTTNWRPEYLVLLGLPVAAATAAKAAVTSANSGRGPLGSMAAKVKTDPTVRVYVRDPVPHQVRGFLTGLAELMTGDDNAVAWADLQYVVFTLITLCYFVIQLLGQPGAGLPPVPAALLTLMGVSASGYTANKVVNTKGKAS